MKKKIKWGKFILYCIFITLTYAAVFTGGMAIGEIRKPFGFDNPSFTYLGLWTVNYSYIQYPGDWVHVNIQGMDFDEALKVCKHEVGHEIFANACEDKWEECANITRIK